MSQTFSQIAKPTVRNALTTYNMGHLLQPARRDAGSAFLVFLHLLEGEAECGTQLLLAPAASISSGTGRQFALGTLAF
jgi:hypothetical protein